MFRTSLVCPEVLIPSDTLRVEEYSPKYQEFKALNVQGAIPQGQGFNLEGVAGCSIIINLGGPLTIL